MKKIFIVDLENVHCSGLIGADKLSNEDEIIIFESEICTTPIEMIPETKANIIFNTSHNGYPNSMDIKVIGKALLVYEPDNYIYIISSDKGYTGIIEAVSKLGVNNIALVKNIEQGCLDFQLKELEKKREEIDKDIEKIKDLILIADPEFPHSEFKLEEILEELDVELTPKKLNNLKKRILTAEKVNDLEHYLNEIASARSDSIPKEIRADYKILFQNAERLFNCKKELLAEKISAE